MAATSATASTGAGSASTGAGSAALAGSDRRVCLLVGGTAGIGKEAAIQMVALGGWDVFVTGRNLERANAAAADVNKLAGVPAESYGSLGAADAGAGAAAAGHGGQRKGRCYGAGPLDLGSLASVREFAATWLRAGAVTDSGVGAVAGKDAAALPTRPLHALILNAGLIENVGVKTPQHTEDGFERTVGVNHLAPFLLTRLLLPSLRASGGARVVSVASVMHDPRLAGHKNTHLDWDNLQLLAEGTFNANLAYCNSKLMNVCFSRELDRRLKSEGADVTAVSLHPGWITQGSDLLRSQNCCVGCLCWTCWTCCCHFCGKQQSVEEGGATEAYCATSSDLKGGEYVSFNLKPVKASVEARDDDVCKRLWTESEKLLGLEAVPEGRAA